MNAPQSARIPGTPRLEIERDELNSDFDRIRIVGDDWQGQFEIATFNHRYSRKEMEGTARLMASAGELEKALRLAEQTLKAEHAKNSGPDAGIVWYTLEQVRAALANAA